MTIYFIKSVLCSALFLFAYKAMFEREKTHVFNRFFLLFGLVLPFVIPLLTFSNHTPMTATVEKVLSVTKVVNASGGIQHLLRQNVNYRFLILLIIYLTVTTLLAVRFISNLKRILKSVVGNSIVFYKSAKIVLVSQKLTPHSFLELPLCK
jgi:uncharacterized membrane protein YfcA